MYQSRSVSTLYESEFDHLMVLKDQTNRDGQTNDGSNEHSQFDTVNKGKLDGEGH